MRVKTSCFVCGNNLVQAFGGPTALIKAGTIMMFVNSKFVETRGRTSRKDRHIKAYEFMTPFGKKIMFGLYQLEILEED